MLIIISRTILNTNVMRVGKEEYKSSLQILLETLKEKRNLVIMMLNTIKYSSDYSQYQSVSLHALISITVKVGSLCSG